MPKRLLPVSHRKQSQRADCLAACAVTSNKTRHVKNVTYIFVLGGEPRLMVTTPKITLTL